MRTSNCFFLIAFCLGTYPACDSFADSSSKGVTVVREECHFPISINTEGSQEQTSVNISKDISTPKTKGESFTVWNMVIDYLEGKAEKGTVTDPFLHLDVPVSTLDEGLRIIKEKCKIPIAHYCQYRGYFLYAPRLNIDFGPNSDEDFSIGFAGLIIKPGSNTFYYYQFFMSP